VNNPIDVQSNEPVVEVEHHDQYADPRLAQFREAFASSQFHLLEPVHSEVNYSFEAMPADPYILELRADKWWLGENGQVENSTLTLNTYDLEQDEVQRETVREEAMMEREDLLRIHAAQGLEAAMHKAEDLAIDNDCLDEDRDDPRLFAEGPPDRFLAQREHADGIGDLLEEPPIDLEDTAPANVWQADGGHETWELDL
jgi:hypothetical protein